MEIQFRSCCAPSCSNNIPCSHLLSGLAVDKHWLHAQANEVNLPWTTCLKGPNHLHRAPEQHSTRPLARRLTSNQPLTPGRLPPWLPHAQPSSLTCGPCRGLPQVAWLP